MSDPGQRPAEEGLLERENVDVQDDAVIGKAFRISLLGLLAVGAVVAAALAWARRPAEQPPEQQIEATAPQRVERLGEPPAVFFTDITAKSGVTFVHANGGYGDRLLPETMGSGVAIFDFDNDGDQDLLFVNGKGWDHRPPLLPAPTPVLYANDGRGRFTDVTAEVGLDQVSLYGTGVAVADVDGDGWRDLYFCAVGENRLLFYRQGRFVDGTAPAGVAGGAQDWSTSASFFDYDGDGDLDLFVANYVVWSKEIDFEQDFRLTGVGRAYGPPQSYRGSYPRLFRNEGEGRFTDVSAAAGVQVNNPATGEPMAKALGLAPVDVDGDGHIDLLVSNDTVQNFFFHNLGDGSFEEVGEFFGLAYDRDGGASGAMGVDSGLYRNDSNLGFLIGNFANEMTSIYVSQDDPSFYVDEAITEGIGAPSRRSLSFGLFFFDYDLDGRLDLFETNGHIENEINSVDPSQHYRQPSQLFWNAGAEHTLGFVLVAPQSVGDLYQPIVGRGAAYGDLDGDGDLDLVVTQTGAPALILRNDQQEGHHWLRVQLAGEAPNRDAIGSWIELEAGGVVQRRQVMPTKSYLSQAELPVTFGLGAAEKVDSLVVTWPDGVTQPVTVDEVDQRILVDRQ